MKIRVISSKEEIETIEDNEEIVHIAFRPSNKDIIMLVQKCSKLKAIHVPKSYKSTISRSTYMFLEMQGIAFLEGDIWGHKKDIYEYYEINSRVLDRIEELKKEGKSHDEITVMLGMETNLSLDLIKVLVFSP